MATGLPFFPTHWYYNTETGQLTQGNNLENLGNNLVGGAGWHELTIPGSATAAQAAAEAKREFPNGTPPTTAGITPKRVIDNTVNQATGNNKGSQGASLFSWSIGGVSGHNLLIRGLKIILGGILLTAGIMKLAGADRDALGVVTQTAGKLPGV